MAQNKKMPGLLKRNGVWHIDKFVNGRRICESAGTNDLQEAEKYLVRRLEILRQAEIYGVRPKRIFREAATKYLLENQHKRSIAQDARVLKMLDSFIGDIPLDMIHRGILDCYVEKRRAENVKARTINHGLQMVRRILNLAAQEWIDEYGFSWIVSAPKIKLLPLHDARKPYPLTWQEQEVLFEALPLPLKEMALFAVNTGCRDQEICKLRWEWEMFLNDSNIPSVFLIPSCHVKNGCDRLVVLNQIARDVIERQRGKHPEFVFVYRGKPVTQMHNNGWRKARKLCGLPRVRVHDLKHTFGYRLRAAGVGFEDRQDLLGHKSHRITTHYSTAELCNLVIAANKVCKPLSESTLILVRGISQPKLTSHTLQ